MNEYTALKAQVETPALHTGLSIFDDGTFISIMRVADAMAHSPLVPESLRTKKVNGKVEDLSHEEIKANCFLICEQSGRWKISPFAALACASNIHGRLMWEGKLVAGVLESNLGVRLNYEYSGAGDKMQVVVIGTLPGEDTPRTVTGVVADWKTAQWVSSAYEQRMSYRGAREWARRHAPSIMLGVLTEDEEPPQIRNVTPAPIQTVKLRDTPIGIPAPAAPAAAPEAAPVIAPAATEPEEAEKAPAPAKQKKECHVRDAKFKTITAKEGTHKTFWVVAVLIAGKYMEFTTFSSTIAEGLGWLDQDAAIRITVVQGKEKDQFSLQAYELIVPEGSLI